MDQSASQLFLLSCHNYSESRLLFIHGGLHAICAHNIVLPGLQEIYDWAVAPGNQGEMVVVHINDESHSADWGHIDLIQDPVAQTFRDLLFTPEDKKSLFPNSWLVFFLSLLKYVVITSSCTSFSLLSSSSVFYSIV